MFSNCKTLDELKKAYRKAAMDNHPDRGGSTKAMQRINAEYEKAFEALKYQQNSNAANGKQYHTDETPADFINILDVLFRIPDLEIELCGRWLWIGGDTFKSKDLLKAAGCKWSAKKKLWSWHFPEEHISFHKAKSMDEIREKYGSQIIDTPKTDNTTHNKKHNSKQIPA